MRKRLLNKAHCGFTMVEVMIASAILALIASLSLGGAWRLAGFARDEAERMMADAYCHDVMWRLFQMSDETLANFSSTKTYKPPKGTLPVLISTKADGSSEVVSPLWREGYAQPICKVKASPCVYVLSSGKWKWTTNSTKVEGSTASNVLITVYFKWGRTEDVGKTNYLQVVRSGRVDRWANTTTGEGSNR